MKKFSFPLESVLQYRKHMLKQAELDLGAALAEEKSLEHKLAKLAEQTVTMTKQSRGETNFAEITRIHKFYEFLEQQKNHFLSKLAEAKIVSEKKRVVLREAMKKASSLEKLREKLFLEYKSKSITEEFAIADDVTNARTARRILNQKRF